MPTLKSFWIATHARSPTKWLLHEDVFLRNVEWAWNGRFCPSLQLIEYKMWARSSVGRAMPF